MVTGTVSRHDEAADEHREQEVTYWRTITRYEASRVVVEEDALEIEPGEGACLEASRVVDGGPPRGRYSIPPAR